MYWFENKAENKQICDGLGRSQHKKESLLQHIRNNDDTTTKKSYPHEQKSGHNNLGQ